MDPVLGVAEVFMGFWEGDYGQVALGLGTAFLSKKISGVGKKVGYHATHPEAAEAILAGGFKKGKNPGRLGSHGTYVNSTPEGAVKEFDFHNPGVKPKVLEVEYSSGVNANASVPPRNYVSEHPLSVDSISAPSVRAPNTINTNILNGSANPTRVLP